MLRLSMAKVARRFVYPTLALVLVGAVLTAVVLLRRHHWRAAQESLDRERYADARQHLDWCFALGPGSEELALLAARIERLDNHFDESERHLKEAMRLHGGATDDTQLEWILLRCQKGEIDRLASDLWYCVKQGHPSSPMILETLARRYMLEGRVGEALPCLDRWIELEPDNVRARDLRGWVYERLDRRSGAIPEYLKCLEHDPGRASVRLRLANVYLFNAEPEPAREQLDILRRTSADDVEIQVAVAHLHFLVGELDAACDQLDAVARQQPKHLRGLVLRAKAELQRGNPKAAERWARQALEVDPHDLEGHFNLYLSLRTQGGHAAEADQHQRRYEEIKRHRRETLDMLRPEHVAELQNPERSTELGKMFLDIGEDRLGLDWLYRTLDRAPQFAPAHAALADYYDKHNDPEKARRHRQSAP